MKEILFIEQDAANNKSEEILNSTAARFRNEPLNKSLDSARTL